MDLKLRGRHINDFFWYFLARELGDSHHQILDARLEGVTKVFENGRMLHGIHFEKYSHEIYRSIYDGEVGEINFALSLDDICRGPKDNTIQWCRKFNFDPCLGRDAGIQDKIQVEEMGFQLHSAISGKNFLKRMHEIKPLYITELLPKIINKIYARVPSKNKGNK